MPTEQDYLDLEMSWEESRTFVGLVAVEGPAAVDVARRMSGTSHAVVLAKRVPVEVVSCSLEEGTEVLEEIHVSISMSPVGDEPPLPADYLMAIVAALKPPEFPVHGVEYGGRFPGRAARANEIVVCLRSF